MILTASDVSSLGRALSRWEVAEYVFAGLVTVACAGEYLADFKDWFTGGDKAKKDRLAKRSTLLLIAALALELTCLVKTNSLSGQLIGSLDEKAGAADIKAQSAIEESSLAENKASRADTSAGEAKHKTDAVAQQADALSTRMESASNKLGVLEQDIIAQGPRSPLLVKAAPELVKQLEPFAGQRVGLFVCGRLGTQDQETVETWAAIARILNTDDKIFGGAKWKEVPTNCMYFDNCARGFQGVAVYLSKRASKNTMGAAKALSDGIANALLPSRYNALVIVDPETTQLFLDRKLDDKSNPWILAGTDPDLVTVLIGAHPTQWVEMAKAKR